MILGIVIGVVFMILLILAFAAGYGWNKVNNKDEEEL